MITPEPPEAPFEKGVTLPDEFALPPPPPPPLLFIHGSAKLLL